MALGGKAITVRSGFRLLQGSAHHQGSSYDALWGVQVLPTSQALPLHRVRKAKLQGISGA